MADIIIVVDDEKEIADLIALYLENDGFEVHKFLTGADALKFVEKAQQHNYERRSDYKHGKQGER